MVESQESGESSERAPRAPLTADVRIRFEDRPAVSADAANISLTGMFVRMQQPPPAGTRLRFELTPSDGASIAGSGEVVWSRLQEESADRPAGMGILFFRLGEGGRDVISGVVDRHLASSSKGREKQ